MIARVFARKTKATPNDQLAFTRPCNLTDFTRDITEVHVSVTWTYDLDQAYRLAESWGALNVPVRIGGPATGEAGGEFVPGMYLRHGYVITSRGCPNACWFCSVWRREGRTIRELPIRDGYNVLDDNLLACSEGHIRAVFAMLNRQQQPAEFTGGLEAARLQSWHVNLLAKSRVKQAFFAYDTPEDYEPLRTAGKMLHAAGIGITDHSLRCYVLIGYPNDTFENAEARLLQTIEAGFMPMAMLWRDDAGCYDMKWKRFQREWASPIIVGAKMRAIREGLKRGGKC